MQLVALHPQRLRRRTTVGSLSSGSRALCGPRLLPARGATSHLGRDSVLHGAREVQGEGRPRPEGSQRALPAGGRDARRDEAPRSARELVLAALGEGYCTRVHDSPWHGRFDASGDVPWPPRDEPKGAPPMGLAVRWGLLQTCARMEVPVRHGRALRRVRGGAHGAHPRASRSRRLAARDGGRGIRAARDPGALRWRCGPRGAHERRDRGGGARACEPLERRDRGTPRDLPEPSRGPSEGGRTRATPEGIHS